MTVTLAMHARQGRMLGLRAVIDTGGAGGMRFYEGTRPAALDENPATSPLASVTFALPAGAVGAVGTKAVLALTTPKTGTVAASGNADYVQVVDGLGATICYMDISTVGDPDPKPVVVSERKLWAGGEVILLSCVFSE